MVLGFGLGVSTKRPMPGALIGKKVRLTSMPPHVLSITTGVLSLILSDPHITQLFLKPIRLFLVSI